MPRQYAIDSQRLRLLHDLRPIPDVGIRSVVVWTVDHRIARADDLFLGQINESIAARVGPSEEMKLDAAGRVFDYVRRFGESLFGRLGGVALQIGHVGSLLGGVAPAARFVALQFFSDAGVLKSIDLSVDTAKMETRTISDDRLFHKFEFRTFFTDQFGK